MRFVICYDIADNGRRERLAAALLDFGPRIQESVFLATLDEALYEQMIGRVRSVVSEEWDRVHVFAICASCEAKARSLGCGEIPEDKEYYIV